LADDSDLFERLARSAFRRKFRLAGKDLDYLREKGLPAVLLHAREIIAKRLAPSMPAKDGKQTPFRGHPVFVAQHATGTCCRSCLAKWHNIPKGKVLTPGDQKEIVAVIGRWLELQSQAADQDSTSEP
jgi:hypothetical protein